jgi:hypothetical protein
MYRRIEQAKTFSNYFPNIFSAAIKTCDQNKTFTLEKDVKAQRRVEV